MYVAIQAVNGEYPFCYGQAHTYTRHSTNAVSMLGQRRRRCFIVFVGYMYSQRLRR